MNKDEDYYDKIVYIKNGKYSLNKIGRVAGGNIMSEKRKIIVDALENENVQTVSGNGHSVKILYKTGRVKYY